MDAELLRLYARQAQLALLRNRKRGQAAARREVLKVLDLPPEQLRRQAERERQKPPPTAADTRVLLMRLAVLGGDLRTREAVANASDEEILALARGESH
jgi:hypothetical protein